MENKDKKFIVEFWDEDDEDIGIKPHWHRVPLDMCHGDMLCDNCKKDIKHLDSCDYNFYFTYDEQVAIDRRESLEEEGCKVRIVNK